jgi:hypothetical protein
MAGPDGVPVERAGRGHLGRDPGSCGQFCSPGWERLTSQVAVDVAMASVAASASRGRASARRGVAALALFELSKILKIERRDYMAGRVEVLAAGQAPGAAYRFAAGVADPEPGRVVPAVDAQLDGVRQQAGPGYRAPPEVPGGGSRPVLAGRHARARCHVREEPYGEGIAARSADQVGFLAAGLARVLLTRAGSAGPAGQCTADAADAIHCDLLMGWEHRPGHVYRARAWSGVT